MSDPHATLPTARPAHAPAPTRAPVSFDDVYRHELTQLARLGVDADAPATRGVSASDAAERRSLFRAVGQLDDEHALSALCLSGGGIRSATFNLGVIQALARVDLVDRFDYVSSVSGGGYIAGWLKAWMRRDGSASVISHLAEPAGSASFDPLVPEPAPIDALRQYSNYLTPRLGLFSPDTWAAGTIILRNLLLNWLVIVPLLAAAVAAPQLTLIIAASDVHPTAGAVAAVLAVLAEVVAGLTIHYYRKRSLESRGIATEGRVFARSILPLYVAAVCLAQAGLWWHGWTAPHWWRVSAVGDAWLFALVWCIGVPTLTWSAHIPRGRAAVELVALLGSGIIGAALFVPLIVGVGPYLVEHPPLYVIFALPALLANYLVARMLFVAIASRSDPEGRPSRTAHGDGCSDALDSADHDREWWARLTGWVLALALAWLVVSAVCVLGGYALDAVRHTYAGAIATALGGASGIVTAVLGRSAATGSGRGPGDTTPSLLRRLALAAAVPLFCVLLVVLVARGNTLAGRLATGDPDLLCVPAHLVRDMPCDVAAADLMRGDEVEGVDPSGVVVGALDGLGVHAPDIQRVFGFLLVPALLVAVGATAGLFVNPNRFSLHGFYRNRLVRAYLGASHTRRKPDPFTGFAANDNLRLHELWHPAHVPAAHPDDAIACTRPLPIINTTLNLVSGERLAWQQRRAESFSMTPFFCGNHHEGYRPTRSYGGSGGMTLGTAMTISGAAANPNMGYNSSPLVTFLMTLFNARLGAWLGNTNRHGSATYAHPGPRWAVGPIFNELFGRTNDRSPYVNLSDGGHFDNLGLYEVVLRRCRHVVVCDAGRDPAYGFEDLGNAIRKIRIDFGVEIRFDDQIEIRSRTAGVPGLYCAMGTIDYAGVDGPQARPGWLLYIKPALNGELAPVPYDVFSYAQRSTDFPHETTTDQWFDESQFESYRALGEHIMARVARGDDPTGGSVASLPALRAAAAAYVRSMRGDGPSRLDGAANGHPPAARAAAV